MNGRPSAQSPLARLAAAAAFLLAVTVLALLVRSSLQAENASVTPTATAPAATVEEPVDEPAETEPPPGTIATPTTTATAEPPADAEFYEVQSGDTLAAIADAHGTTVEELVALNPGVDPVQLSIGQRLRVR